MYQANHSLALDLTLPVNRWLVDETLYSLCCRFHYVSSNALASTSARQLFGHPRHGTQHDFASRINVFVQRTQGNFGVTAREVIQEHTITPFYLPWRTEGHASTIMQHLCAGNAGKIKSLLGLPSSRIRANHPLKACPLCMQADKQRFGVAYWHLTHQLPGVWICRTHACGLLESDQKATGVGRFLWHLPHEGAFYPLPSALDSTGTSHWLERLADAATAIFKLAPGVHIDHRKLVGACRYALQERGLLRGQVQVALQDAAQQYLQFTQALNFSGLDIPLPTDLGQAKLQLGRLFSLPQRSTHPLRHLLIILWLFGNWDDFWDVYTDAEPHPLSSRAKAMVSSPEPQDQRKTQVLHLVQVHGMTISQAARQVGVSVQTAQTWASAQGLLVPKRPKTSTEQLKAIIRELRHGKPRSAIAHKHHVSVQTITRLLKTDPGLREQWQQAHNASHLLATRRTWQNTIKRNPQAILKELRALQPGCYSWLYRHDRLWLTESLAHVPKYQRIPAGHVNWIQRDHELVELLSTTVQNIKSVQAKADITLQKIYQSAPSIKPYLSKLKQLPLTRQLLEQVCHRSFAPKSTLPK